MVISTVTSIKTISPVAIYVVLMPSHPQISPIMRSVCPTIVMHANGSQGIIVPRNTGPVPINFDDKRISSGVVDISYTSSRTRRRRIILVL